mmetsp:Transcript_77154/g.89776  ORF Transcript_77154/g.89776 Transcript_77154/m.89776 type:complete len:547 (-) Transcript_77154:57-1697(-)|eukprot:CAMPEP_0176428742 /NCGR_PEP_ID=MMETSP0127-20121128/13323_1 /TAXON_ID=938130 /ORGANISM="Platyophrya macrostoma, Strain WH" /LENGTH=546 /DNA_ID=CAMNT_0017810467 /DNA_START=33 /DNA_END=1673 /DNA_ORIENTATION=-
MISPSNQPALSDKPIDKAKEQPVSNTTQPNSAEQLDSGTQAPVLSLFHEIAFIALICMSQLLTQASLAESISILGYISDNFNATDGGTISWYAAAFSLTVGIFILPSGRLGDLYGHKNLVIFGWIWMGIFSIICGLAAYVPDDRGSRFFSAMKAMQGIGPAILLPNGIAIIGLTYPPGLKKNMIFSLFGATAPGGFVIGAAFSALLAEHAWWPWGYWIMGIVNVVLAFLVIFIVPSRPHAAPRPRGFKATWNSLDITGIILGLAGLLLFNFAWNQGPVVGWQTPYTYILLIIGLLIMVFFFIHESRAPTPLIPVHALGPATVFVLICIAAGWASFGIWMFYFWEFSFNLRDLTPLLVTAEVSPVVISGALAALSTGLILHKIGPAYTILISMIAFFIGNVLFATMSISQTYWAESFVGMIITPWGMDMSFPAASILLSNAVKEEHQGVAASLVNTVLNYSISIGLGIAGTVCRQVNPEGRQDLWFHEYRSAWYTSMALSGLGIIVAASFVMHHELVRRKVRKQKVKNVEMKTGADTEATFTHQTHN